MRERERMSRGYPPPMPRTTPLLAALLLAAPLAADDAAVIRSHVRFLSSDLLEGRAPGERGGELTMSYLESQMERIGLRPAGDGGTYRQTFELVGVTVREKESSYEWRTGSGEPHPLRWLDEIVGVPEHQIAEESVSAPLVFVGHGVVAPEEEWDDFGGADLSGAVIVMLVDDPPATPEEPKLFGGRARTYYGRWTYKLEQARRLGAAGALLIHSDGSAGYGWNVVRSSWSGEDRQNAVRENEPRLSLAAWISNAAARELFTAAGKNLDDEVARAHRRGFHPVPLGITFTAKTKCDIRRIRTSNVLGLLPGRDATLSAETVVLTAHWDHLGIGEPDDRGDRIYNGAVDNASGVGTLLAVAERMAKERAPKRSILFFASAAEESGILGTAWFVEHPLRDLRKVAAVVNSDSVPVREIPLELQIAGADRLDASAELLALARHLGFRTIGDPAPEQGSFYRSDHFPFAKKGVPALNLRFGEPLRGLSAEESAARVVSHKKRYHSPADEYDPTWSFEGTAKTAELLRSLAKLLGDRPKAPRWNAGDEFAPKAAAGGDR